jgi:hypothetical protein
MHRDPDFREFDRAQITGALSCGIRASISRKDFAAGQ